MEFPVLYHVWLSRHILAYELFQFTTKYDAVSVVVDIIKGFFLYTQ